MSRSSLCAFRLWGVVMLLGLAGCPKPGAGPAGFVIPKSEDPAAQRRFAAARAKFEDGDFSAAGKDMEAFIKAFPHDPLAQTARLFAGRAAYELGDWKTAELHLAPLASPGDGLPRKARYFLGLTLVERGEWVRAQQLLAPIAAAPDGDGGEELGALAAALAEASYQRGEVAAALGWLGRWHQAADAGPSAAEKVHILARAQELTGKLTDAEVGPAYRALPRGGAVAAVVAVRLSAVLSAAGDGEGAARVLAETAAAREAAGLGAVGGAAPAAAGPGDPRVIGVLFGQTGATRQVGERALRGLGLALGLNSGAGQAARSGYLVVARDPGSEATAAAAVDALVAEGAIAIVGPIDKKQAAAAARRASELGVPILPLTGFAADVPAELPGVFRVVVSAEARARALAVRAAAEGIKRVAVIAPDNAYGKKVGEAFVVEARARGLEVGAVEAYAKDATSFGKAISAVKKAGFDALFVPDTARRLELITPALAAADLWPLPEGGKPVKGRRILLLSTAEGLSPDLLRAAGRYVQGALLAPGFYPDESEPALADYVRRYRGSFGEEPSLFDASAYDAALALRRVIESGGRDRSALALGLLRPGAPGATGVVSFAAGVRSDAGWLFSVEGEVIRVAQE
ncbi:MAG: penicillin-binding protein activator [Deltaproteobacteria bacterium]|nr:penicillin-binding protein activator [Deltaproteobacteria bacterium]